MGIGVVHVPFGSRIYWHNLLAGRIYRTGILMYGKKIRLQRIVEVAAIPLAPP